jgi:hypothetical protein
MDLSTYYNEMKNQEPQDYWKKQEKLKREEEEKLKKENELISKYFNSEENIKNIKEDYEKIKLDKKNFQVGRSWVSNRDVLDNITSVMQPIFNILYKHYEGLSEKKLTDQQKEVFRFLLYIEENRFILYTALPENNNNVSNNYLRNKYKNWIIKREDFANFVREIGLDKSSISYHEWNRDNYEPLSDRISRVGKRWKSNFNNWKPFSAGKKQIQSKKIKKIKKRSYTKRR